MTQDGIIGRLKQSERSRSQAPSAAISDPAQARADPLNTRSAGRWAAADARPNKPLAASASRPRTEALLFSAALLLSLYFAARTMAPAFQPGVVQDDARQHIFWMARFRDATLFRDDPIADYFEAVAPPGYKALYWLTSLLIEPLLASKLLPFALGLTFAGFLWLVVRRLHRSPAAAFLATTLATWYAWQHGDIVSGTPRAFHLPLLAVQLWAMASHRAWLAAGLVVLAGLFYPSAGLLGLALLGLWLVRYEGGRAVLARERSVWLGLAVATGLLGTVLLVQLQASAPYGPVVSLEEARRMDEFDRDGRSVIFNPNPYRYWIASPRTGFDLMVREVNTRTPIILLYLAVAAILPLMVLLGRPAAIRDLRPESVLLVHLLSASLGLFLLAHLVLFRLYLPSRYVKTSVPLALAVASGLVLGLLVGALWARAGARRGPILAALLCLGLGLALAVYPISRASTFVEDPNRRVTAFLLQQPADTLVAGASVDTDSLPVLARRRVLTSREFLNPYHLGFYLPLRAVTEDLVDAYYARSRDEFATFAQRYGVDYMLVNRTAYTESTALEPWFEKFEPFRSRIEAQFRHTRRFWLRDASRSCGTVVDREVTLSSTDCLLAVK
jgi:hypothetical protein